MSDLSVLEMLHKDRKESVFILLDGAVFPAMQRVYDYEISPQVSPLYYGTRHESSLDVSPCLYQPSGESEIWKYEKHWRKHGLVFSSAYSYFEVLNYLKSLISIRLPNEQLAYWRFYSPDWFSMIMSCFSNEELSMFTGPVNQWATYTGGRWELYKAVGHDFFEKNKEEGWFQLSQNCIEKIKKIKKEEFYIQVERELTSQISAVDSEKVLRKDVVGIVDRAERLGFKSVSELEWFVLMHYKYPGLMNADSVKELVGNVEFTVKERQFKVEKLVWGITEEVEG